MYIISIFFNLLNTLILIGIGSTFGFQGIIAYLLFLFVLFILYNILNIFRRTKEDEEFKKLFEDPKPLKKNNDFITKNTHKKKVTVSKIDGESEKEIKHFKKIDPEILSFLLKNGADINYIYNSKNGNTLLHLLLKRGDVDNAKLFIENGARLDIKNTFGKTPLEYGDKSIRREFSIIQNLSLGKNKLVMKLIESGANIKEKDKDGNSALHIASKKGAYDISKILLQKGVDINAENNYGETALLLSIMYKKYEITDFLLKNKANIKFPNYVNNYYTDIIKYAYKDNNKVLIEILKKHNIKVPLRYRLIGF